MSAPDLAAAIVIASFAVFGLVAQVARARAVATRGASRRRARGIADTATDFFWLPYLVVWLRPGPTLALPAAAMWLGVGLAVAGVVFALAAIAALGRHYDLTLEVHGGHELVRRGPYAIVRHPVYAGLAVHSLGACLATGNLLFVAGTLAITLPIFVARARVEEGLMRDEFGAEYDRYAREVPMLIPGLR
ncbi:MAG TPA: isoprenylcysteine carboxylmethyltransferase family protein [Candidatus Limnocylindria bacterium]|nr:isoprenylcysteine carboxylmethyltransferase family protein [Candidatus Limnocylindria bacterium]